MDTRLAATLIVIGTLGAWAVWHFGGAIGFWRRLSGDRQTCPPHARELLARIDVAMGATKEAGGAPASPAPSTLVQAWADGRSCVWCGGPLVESRLAWHHIALLEPGGLTTAWSDIAVDRLPLALATSLPICWNCHVAATFRRLHPELVTDRDVTAVTLDSTPRDSEHPSA